MSLLSELEARGVTAEDLEKAAAVRLFEKAAAAEGVDLNDLDESRVEELFNHFVSTSTEKEASAMNDEIVELFEKTASAEGIDLDDMSDEDLAALYNHYVENVLPEQIAAEEELEKGASDEEAVFELFEKTASAEGIDLDDMSDEDLVELFNDYVENVLPLQLEDEDSIEDLDKVADADEKLAEAEILGRHMARAYVDEVEKVGAAKKEGPSLRDRAERFGRSYMSALKGEEFREGRKIYGGRMARAERRLGLDKRMGRASASNVGKSKMLRGGLKTVGAYAIPAAVVAGGTAAAMRKEGSFTEEEAEALLLIDAEFGEDVAEDVAEKVAAASLKKRVLSRVSSARERLADLTYKKKKGLARAGELLSGSRLARMRKYTGQKKGVLAAARGRGPDNREARRVLAARGAAGGAAALAAGGGAYAMHKKGSGDVEDLAIEMLDFAGYDV